MTGTNPYLFHVGRLEESKFAVPAGFERATGYTRQSLVDRTTGSVHMGVSVGRLAPGGEVPRCVNAFEKGIYVLEGDIDVQLDHTSVRLGADHYALVPFATPHALRNASNGPVRWFETAAPQPQLPGRIRDIVVVEDAVWPREVPSPELDDVRTQFVGRFKSQKPMIRDASGIRGLKVYRFMEHEFGANHFFMMRGELDVGGVRGRHDHAVEEVYLALAGEADIEIEGQRYPLRPGDYAWTGVGTCHAFFQKGDAPFKWIETQAPQFPGQHASRNHAAWEKLNARMTKTRS
ncbi:MAG: cupin domain-containing protein [Burkholderiales bacterium]